MAGRAVETPTWLERFVALLPLPYAFAALVWAAVIFGPPTFLTLQYLTEGSASLPNLPNVTLNFALLMYLFLVVRYMRLRVVAAEPRIAPRLAGGAEDFHRAFGRMSDPLPVVILTAVMGTLFLASDAALGILPPNLPLTIFNVFVAYVDSLGFLTYLWEFAVASWGLYALGRSSLKLGSFLEDRMMGSRPLGTLAVALASAYFGLLLVLSLLFSTFLPGTAMTLLTFSFFLGVGVALFFLPLTSIHGLMQREKRRILREIGARYARHGDETVRPAASATLDDVRRGIARLEDLQELEILERKATSLPTWPFDIQLVSRFVTIVLSVTAVLAARLITDFLHI